LLFILSNMHSFFTKYLYKYSPIEIDAEMHEIKTYMEALKNRGEVLSIEEFSYLVLELYEDYPEYLHIARRYISLYKRALMSIEEKYIQN